MLLLANCFIVLLCFGWVILARIRYLLSFPWWLSCWYRDMDWMIWLDSPQIMIVFPKEMTCSLRLPDALWLPDPWNFAFVKSSQVIKPPPRFDQPPPKSSLKTSSRSSNVCKMKIHPATFTFTHHPKWLILFDYQRPMHSHDKHKQTSIQAR